MLASCTLERNQRLGLGGERIRGGYRRPMITGGALGVRLNEASDGASQHGGDSGSSRKGKKRIVESVEERSMKIVWVESLMAQNGVMITF